MLTRLRYHMIPVYFALPLVALGLISSDPNIKTQSAELASESSTTEPTEIDPLMLEILRQVDASKNAGSQVGNPQQETVTATNEGTCVDCGKDVTKDIKYETCDSKNDYIDKKLDAIEETDNLLYQLMNQEPDPNSIISPKCTRIAMATKLASNSKNFKSCESGSYSSKPFIGRPCINERYHALMNNSFDTVARCMSPLLGNNAREQKQSILLFMGLFTQESSFHMNAVSQTGAGGIGQMTGPAIDYVTNGYLKDVKANFKEIGDVCEEISENLLFEKTPMSGSNSKSCSRLSISNGNPITGLVYAMTNVYGMMKDIENDIFLSEKYGDKFALPPHELVRLKLNLAMWAHNTGLAGLESPLRSLLKYSYSSKRVTNVDQFIKEMEAAMKKWPHPESDTSSRRKETSEYLGHIHSQIEKIETATGGYSCVQ